MSGLSRVACSCRLEGLKSCASAFSVGEILDIRIERMNMGFSEEKLARQRELKIARDSKKVGGSKKLKVLLRGKDLCLNGYMTICCVPRSSGS
jgi:hypothetical protein